MTARELLLSLIDGNRTMSKQLERIAKLRRSHQGR